MMKILKNSRGAMQFSESLALKAVSILLALILWITILSLKAEEKKIRVPLRPKLPPGMVIINNIPSFVEFTLSGPRVWVNETEKRLSHHPYQPDLSKTRDSTIGLAISEDLLGDLPVGVKVVNYYPPQVLIRLDEMGEKYIPVRASFKGSPQSGFELAGVKITPSKVPVSGPLTVLQDLEVVGTEAFDIENLHGTQEKVLQLEVDETKNLGLPRENQVKVRVFTRKVNR